MENSSKKKTKSFRLKTPYALIIIVVEILLAVLFCSMISQMVSINTVEDTDYDASDYKDEIYYSEGLLRVNHIEVRVPHGDKVEYNISYAWGENDDEYPTVPKSAIASYKGVNGESKYDIVLYRDSFTALKDVPEGKQVSNWFDDWQVVDDDNSKQSIKKVGERTGFLVSTIGNDPGGEYEESSFYFADKTKNGISVYVVEGILYDGVYTKDFNKIYEEVLTTIRTQTKKQAV